MKRTFLIIGIILWSLLVCSVTYFSCNNSNGQINQQIFNQFNTTCHRTVDNQLHKSQGVCKKGQEPLSKTWVISELLPFLKVYDKRPKNSNKGGTKVMHQFALWCLIRKLKPEFIIESGIYQGLGTWIIRQAAPKARLITLDPTGKNLIYQDNQTSSVYLVGKDFIDFKNVAWTDFVEPSRTLAFIDDHQFPPGRIKTALRWGIKHLVFDDNYWNGGDVFSLKKGCAAILGDRLNKSQLNINRMNLKLNSLKVKEILKTYKELFSYKIHTYFEFPMIWHDSFSNTNSDNRNVLFPVSQGRHLVETYHTNLPPAKELNGYYNIAYVRLN